MVSLARGERIKEGQEWFDDGERLPMLSLSPSNWVLSNFERFARDQRKVSAPKMQSKAQNLLRPNETKRNETKRLTFNTVQTWAQDDEIHLDGNGRSGLPSAKSLMTATLPCQDHDMVQTSGTPGTEVVCSKNEIDLCGGRWIENEESQVGDLKSNCESRVESCDDDDDDLGRSHFQFQVRRT